LSNQIGDVALDASGACWIATNAGISVFGGSGFTNHTNASTGGGLPSDDVTCLFLDAAGGMWVGTAANGAVRYSGSVWQAGYTMVQGMASDSVTCIGEDSTAPTSQIWFGHDSAAGLSIWNGSAFSTLGTGDGLSNGNVNGIDFDSSNVAWIATNNGLNRYDGAFTLYNTGNGLPANNCQDVDVDSSDHVWIATWAANPVNGGVAELQPPATWNTYTTANGLIANQTRTILADKGATVRVGTDVGMSWLIGSNWTSDLMGNAPLSHWNTLDIAVDGSGRVWLATGYGVTRMNSETSWDAWSTGNSSLSGDNPASVYVDGSGVAWQPAEQ
ncbi:MAG: ligand-binding sensor domain-containing protein, partial [Planctomycetota bacterium]